MSRYEDETGPIEHIVKNKYVRTANGRYGIFQRADESDVQEYTVEKKLEEYDEIFPLFAEAINMNEYGNDAVYYHNNLEGSPDYLHMAYTSLSSNPYDTQFYFIVDYKKFGSSDIPLLIVRLNGRLGVDGPSDTLTVWGYDKENKRFTYPRDVESKERNTKTYKNLIGYIRNEKGSVDPFFTIASAVYSM